MDTTTARRVSTRSPVALVRKALQVASHAMPAYASKFSKKDFTQHQLLAMLALKQFLGTDDRGLVACLADWSDLRDALGIDKVPHFTTLFHAQQRLGKKGASTSCSARSSPTPRRPGSSSPSPRRRSTRRAWTPPPARTTTPGGWARATACGPGRS
jgi:Transposase domain (DUF772)